MYFDFRYQPDLLADSGVIPDPPGHIHASPPLLVWVRNAQSQVDRGNTSTSSLFLNLSPTNRQLMNPKYLFAIMSWLSSPLCNRAQLVYMMISYTRPTLPSHSRTAWRTRISVTWQVSWLIHGNTAGWRAVKVWSGRAWIWLRTVSTMLVHACIWASASLTDMFRELTVDPERGLFSCLRISGPALNECLIWPWSIRCCGLWSMGESCPLEPRSSPFFSTLASLVKDVMACCCFLFLYSVMNLEMVLSVAMV